MSNIHVNSNNSSYEWDWDKMIYQRNGCVILYYLKWDEETQWMMCKANEASASEEWNTVASGYNLAIEAYKNYIVEQIILEGK